MNSKDLRSSFLNFFENKNHYFVRSAPVTPINDPTLLFTNAGMNQFKSIFLDKEKPVNNRVMNSQKCVRVSGKHNDLEEVGLDTFHHTFFEMLGNWSFGDYYKEETISWAWQLLTKEWEIDKNRLWATVYKTDDESFKLWKKVTDIQEDRILRFGDKYNFWEMGETGPCGPCSEIHYYMGEDVENQDPDKVNISSEYWELWNLVFIQYNRISANKLEDLTDKHVDTGAGLERLTSVLQRKKNNYDTDLFYPIIQNIEELSGISSINDPIPFRVIADHIRMLSISIADGVLPANEGRGYVLRRILRRAARFGRQLKFNEPFLKGLVESVCFVLGETYPELNEKRKHIQNVIHTEETSFNKTLDRGLIHFEKLVQSLNSNTISGQDAFKLYDTYGFPLDLTQLLAKERNINVSIKEFNVEMDIQKKRARSQKKFVFDKDKYQWETIKDGEDSIFLGYDTLTSESEILKMTKTKDQTILILDKTPFYAESGGQVGDTGTIEIGNKKLKVENTIRNDAGSILHFCNGVISGKYLKNKVKCIVEKNRRQAVRINHTATHLLHAALKNVLGEHVHQAGSMVAPDYLRFDLTHHEKIDTEQIDEIETLVNNEILNNILLKTEIKKYEVAREEGVEALFGEKYGDKVRVISVGNFSKELCGGTHVERSGDIGIFKIIDESSLSAGVRRMTAITGKKAFQYIQKQNHLVRALALRLNCSTTELNMRVEQIFNDNKLLEKKLKKKNNTSTIDIQKYINNGESVGESIIISTIIEQTSLDDLKLIGDSLLQKVKSGVGIFGSVIDNKPQILVVVSNDLVKVNILSGNIAKELGKIIGGGGGGRPHLATAGGQYTDKLESALSKGKKIVQELILRETNGS